MSETNTPSAAPFRALLTGLDGVLERERVGLAGLDRIESVGRAGGRPQGLDYACDTVRHQVAAAERVREILAALVPHEAEVRALLERRSAA